MEETTCRLGHNHKNEREAEACDRRRRERALEATHQELRGLQLIQEQRYSFYVNRRAKVAS